MARAPLSLSSMWAVGRFATAAEFRAAAAALGFAAVEFNYETPPAWLEQPGSGLPVRSLHNPCPAQRFANGRWSYELSLGALDEDERATAVRLARETLAAAARLGAQAVVVHVATIPVDTTKQDRLRALVAAGQQESEEFWTLRDALAAERAAQAGPYLEQACRSIRELAAAAAELGVALGLETRVNVYEIPNLSEMVELLDAGRDGPVGYWHDVGHAAVQELLGFGSHRAWLETLGTRCLGAHLHELQGIRDHVPIGSGTMDWPLVARFLPATAIRVCEIDRRATPEEVAQGVTALARYGVI
ncbi:MAG: sugar phosphate isomerase/epimerase [Chloroflexi bacterium]|nr:sugar phosphate isomerase/epimerase [Chloroflexota bacterium]